MPRFVHTDSTEDLELRLALKDELTALVRDFLVTGDIVSEQPKSLPTGHLPKKTLPAALATYTYQEFTNVKFHVDEGNVPEASLKALLSALDPTTRSEELIARIRFLKTADAGTLCCLPIDGSQIPTNQKEPAPATELSLADILIYTYANGHGGLLQLNQLLRSIPGAWTCFLERIDGRTLAIFTTIITALTTALCFIFRPQIQLWLSQTTNTLEQSASSWWQFFSGHHMVIPFGFTWNLGKFLVLLAWIYADANRTDRTKYRDLAFIFFQLIFSLAACITHYVYYSYLNPATIILILLANAVEFIRLTWYYHIANKKLSRIALDEGLTDTEHADYQALLKRLDASNFWFNKTPSITPADMQQLEGLERKLASKPLSDVELQLYHALSTEDPTKLRTSQKRQLTCYQARRALYLQLYHSFYFTKWEMLIRAVCTIAVTVLIILWTVLPPTMIISLTCVVGTVVCHLLTGLVVMYFREQECRAISHALGNVNAPMPVIDNATKHYNNWWLFDYLPSFNGIYSSLSCCFWPTTSTPSEGEDGTALAHDGFEEKGDHEPLASLANLVA